MPLHSSVFSIARLPRIEFGAGAISKLPQIAAAYGRHALIITGNSSFVGTPHWFELTSALGEQGIAVTHARRNGGEPSPEEVDARVRALRGEPVDVVIGIGGGSVLDEAKAVAGLLRVGRSVMDFLEGVGPQAPYEGPAVPFIAVPTTAGTGSEATKNAVLSRHGSDGFKKSFRDEKLVAEWAIVDPDLIATCPQPVIVGNGMDALTQLLESYVSTRANPLTDALALQGLRAAREALMPLYDSAGSDGAARTGMAFASLLSGINLAQTGLGSVHGLAAPLGAFFPAPHGVVCGTLVAAATQINIEALREREPSSPALGKYADAGRVLTGDATLADAEARQRLVELLDEWTGRLALPRLASFGTTAADIPRIVANARGSSMKTNPLALEDAEIASIVRARL